MKETQFELIVEESSDGWQTRDRFKVLYPPGSKIINRTEFLMAFGQVYMQKEFSSRPIDASFGFALAEIIFGKPSGS